MNIINASLSGTMYAMRRRIGIPRIIKAAAGPHDLGRGERRGEGPPLEAQSLSGSSSNTVTSLFDDDGDDDIEESGHEQRLRV